MAESEKGWSYSALTNFETCPQRYYATTVSKQYSDVNERNSWGDRVHRSFAAYIKDGTPLPLGMEGMEKTVDQWRLREPHTLELVEQRIAFTKDGYPVAWNGPAWNRSIVDYAAIQHSGHARVVDWKTGKPKEDLSQLYIMATGLFVTYNFLEEIHAALVWLKDGWATEVRVSRNDLVPVLVGLNERVRVFQDAHARSCFPPRPNGLCRSYCPVRECPHHGR